MQMPLIAERNLEVATLEIDTHLGVAWKKNVLVNCPFQEIRQPGRVDPHGNKP
ncbi:hypothetical protein LVB87_11690 [Lysobacter sp. KIS68-7]|uniref:hypothetical protein n=1 Tax=Lysobacter sp. KIS68-7 TaxID=2904252 RepID=UPI001E5BBC1E|nr:hypothetical protein [Lysobacter sp. KIS68-7]UHQ18843.1 hypothetical protein LVB87_11690 [Lysobacter sp. KIS68-7]